MGNASVNLAANCCSCKPDHNALSLESAREEGAGEGSVRSKLGIQAS